MRKIIAFIFSISILCTAAFASNFFEKRYFEIKTGADIGISNNLFSCKDLLKKDLVIDLKKIADDCPKNGFDIRANIDPKLEINLNILEQIIKMNNKTEKENENSNETNQNNLNLTGQDLPHIKKVRKRKKSIKGANTKTNQDQIKVVPLLKPPSKRRKFDKDGKTKIQDNSQTGIIWDNKTIEEQYLDRKLHPRIKIDEPKTPYPDGDDEDIYQEGINKVNEIKLTEELLTDVVASLNEKDKDKIKSNTAELKRKAYSNEYTTALKFYNENKEKYEDLTGERKMSLENTLINKFHKEVRNASKGKIKKNN